MQTRHGISGTSAAWNRDSPLLPLLMGRCDVPEARKGAGDKGSPLKRRAKERGGRKAPPFLPLRPFFIRQLLEVARKKRAKYPPLNAESTHRGFLTRKEGSNGGERERDGEKGAEDGERETGRKLAERQTAYSSSSCTPARVSRY